MKKASTYLVLLCLPLCLIMLASCNSTNTVSKLNDSEYRIDPTGVQPTKSDVSPQSWENLFRRLSGVEVSGAYPNISLKVRGSESFMLSTEPLFVLEGVPLGTNFRNLDGATTPAEVGSIRVMKGSDASIYGVRGANGVIVVTLKNKRKEAAH